MPNFEEEAASFLERFYEKGAHPGERMVTARFGKVMYELAFKSILAIRDSEEVVLVEDIKKLLKEVNLG